MADRFEEGLSGLDAGPADTDAPTAAGGAPAEDADHPTVAALRDRFGDAILHHEIQAGDEHVVFVAAERLREILRWLKEDEGQRYDLLKDLTAVDWGGGRPLQVAYELWSIPNRRQLRLKVELPLDRLEVDSAVPVWRAANWLEREAYDMFGVQFRDHPDLRRILMPENYSEGHPLRKDFPLRGRFTRAEQTRRALSLDVADFYTPDELKVGEVHGDARSAETPGTEPPATGVDAPATAGPAPGTDDEETA